MNEFVNYGSRSVDLPEGCKDLIDVLKPKWGGWFPDGRSFQTVDGGLAVVESHVRRFLGSDAYQLVSVHTEHHELLLTLGYEPRVTKAIICVDSKDTERKAFICVDCTDQKREKALRKVFHDSAILPTSDVVFVTAAGVEIRALKYPLPAFVREATGLITKLLLQGCGILLESRLRFIWIP